MRVAAGRGILSDQSFLPVAQEGKPQPGLSAWKTSLEHFPLSFWPVLLAPGAIKSGTMHGGKEPPGCWEALLKRLSKAER